MLAADPGAGSGGGGGGATSVRGPGLVLRQHARFRSSPETSWRELEVRVKEKLGWEEGENWSMEALARQWPWGHQASLKRQFFMWAKMHRALRSGDMALARGLCAQAIKVTSQAALDSGSYDLAWRAFPHDDPVRPGVRDPFPPAVEDGDPFEGLLAPEEVAAALAYARDMSSLAKARGERLQRRRPFGQPDPGRGGGRGRGDGGGADAGEGGGDAAGADEGGGAGRGRPRRGGRGGPV